MSSKITIKLAGIGTLAIALSGCSHFFKDHADDYRHDTENTVVLQTPPGSIPSRNDLPIPNEKEIANIDKDKAFVAPRARFVFYPMAKVLVTENSDSISFLVPTNVQQTKKMVKDFLMALHGEGESVATENDQEIISVPFQFKKQGWWASLWSSITRSFPEQDVFSFKFVQKDKDTLLSVQFKTEENGENPSDWMSPVQKQTIFSDVIRLWGDMARQLNQRSVFLSERGSKAPFNVWIDHRGILALHINNKNAQASTLDDQLNMAGLQKVPGKAGMISVIHSKDSGEQTISSSADTGNVTPWDEQEYKYDIVHQKAGDFLVIDVASLPNPELTSFLLMQHLVK